MQRTRDRARTRTLWVGALIVASLAMPEFARAAATGAPGPCALRRGADETVRQHSRELIRCAAARWPVRGGATTAICIAKRESGLIPTAASSDGMNKGLFQQHVKYWDANYQTYTRKVWQLRPKILNGRTNTIVSIRMVHRIGWGPWGGSRCG
jgi:hypothetical protein